MSYKQISDSIKKGKTVPLYFLHGEEDYYIDELTRLIENSLLTEDEKSFNLTVLYGKDSDFKQVLDAARRFPIMAERQVVIIKEAQELKTIDNLEAYFENPLDSTVLVWHTNTKPSIKERKLAKRSKNRKRPVKH
jgi:DNA polymerase-3 subunit delta